MKTLEDFFAYLNKCFSVFDLRNITLEQGKAVTHDVLTRIQALEAAVKTKDATQ